MVGAVQGYLSSIFSRINRYGEAERRLPYRLRHDFLSEAEQAFYQGLRTAAGDFLILPRVRLADIFTIPRSQDNYFTYLNKISARHVDFLICNPITLQPLIAIQLAQDNRRLPDTFMEALFDNAGLPLLNLSAERHYDSGELKALFSNVI